MKRVILAITGASGAIYGVRLLEELKKAGVETHLLITLPARTILALETPYTAEDLARLADCSYPPEDLTAPPASGSFLHGGMVVAPCSMKTLAAIAHGYADNLITRAADVTLKEKRPLILVPRETPLSPIHLENMLRLAAAGATVMPPVPAFYHRPRSLADLVDQFTGRVLDLLGIENHLVKRWPSA